MAELEFGIFRSSKPTHAKSRNLILVTNNAREFERVEGLTVENWV